MRAQHPFLLTLALFAAISAPVGAAARWQRLESGRWELATDAGPKAGAALLARMTAAEAVLKVKLAELAPRAGADSSLPVRVILFRSKGDFQAFRSGPSGAGLFQSGADRDHILLIDNGEATSRAACHELVHLLLHHAAPPMPAWLEEGLGEYYATLQTPAAKGGQAVQLGAPIASHLQTLFAAAWMTPAELFSIPNAAAVAADSQKTSLLYAQGWALAHWALARPDGGARLGRFLALLAEGRGQLAAFEAAFEVAPDKAFGDARAHVETMRAEVDGKRFRPREMAWTSAPALLSAAADLNDPAPALYRAEALLANGQAAEAARLIDGAVRSYPQDAGAATLAGALALRRGDFDAARAQLEQAIALGSRVAATHFEYAMLVRDTKGPEALVRQSLRQAVELNPALAEAWYLLGAAELRDGEPAAAAASLEKAVAVLPRQFIFWELHARALHQTGRRAEARASALQALACAKPEQGEQARALLREIDTVAQARPASKPGTATPKGWEAPKGDASVSGRLVLIDCETQTLKFHIETKAAVGRVPAQKVLLATEKPQLVMLRGESAQRREFICGPQAGAPLVEAFYIARPEQAPPPAPVEAKPVAPVKTAKGKKAPARKAAPVKPAAPALPAPAGELVALEFKPEPPKPQAPATAPVKAPAKRPATSSAPARKR